MRKLYIPYHKVILWNRRFQLILFAAVLSLTMWWVEFRIKPVVGSLSSYQARVFATRAINESVAEELTRDGVRYSDLVHLNLREDGSVSSITTDAISLNLLKSELTNAVNERVARFTSETVSVPVGTLFGGQLLSGRGPMVEFKVVPTSMVEARLQNRFDSAGINQTRHQIMLSMKVSVIAVGPGTSVPIEITTEICLAETVIVGVTPDSFTEVTADGQSLPWVISRQGQAGD